MTVRHQPSDEVLGAFAAGRLDEGLGLVVAAHIELNPATAQSLREVSAIGGGFLERAKPVAMQASAGDLLDRLPPAPDAPQQRRRDGESGTPQVLAPYALGPWRTIGRQVAMRRVAVPDSQARVFMLRAGPGIALPHHKHSGREWTVILSGAYEHEYGRFGAGDFDEADENHEHKPFVDAREGCTCLVALTGNVMFQGWLGRLLQPFVRL